MTDGPSIAQRLPGYFLFVFREMKRLFNMLVSWGWEKILGIGEAALGVGSGPIQYPPIFIIGAPRSGSTLLYQLLVERYKIGYLSNAHCRHFRGPAFAEILFRPLKKRKPLDFSSNYGAVEGYAAPSDCGEFWYRFFRRKPMSVSLRDADPEYMNNMRRAIRALSRAFRQPVLIKNMNCALRLEPILKYVPEAIFIVTHRNLDANVASILEARQEIYGDSETWYSLEPKGFEKFLNSSPEDQVRGQIASIYAEIDVARKQTKGIQFLDVQYQTVCENPASVLTEFETLLKGNGVNLEPYNVVPNSFVYKDDSL